MYLLKTEQDTWLECYLATATGTAQDATVYRIAKAPELQRTQLGGTQARPEFRVIYTYDTIVYGTDPWGTVAVRITTTQTSPQYVQKEVQEPPWIPATSLIFAIQVPHTAAYALNPANGFIEELTLQDLNVAGRAWTKLFGAPT
jgi:hypothetical protein